MKKELGRLSRQQLREFYSAYYKTQIEGEVLKSDIAEDVELFKEFLSEAPPWGTWYELPFLTHLSAFLLATGLADKIKEIALQVDPQQALLDFIESDESLPIESESDPDKEEVGYIFSLLFALMNQVKAISIYSEPMSKLVDRARNGDDDALLNAVIVDRSVVATPSIARRIQVANYLDDESFLNRLAKAITKTRTVPRRPRQDIDDARLMIEMIEECIGIDNISRKNLYEVIVEDLELYESEGKEDPQSAFNNLIKKRNKKARS
jgi:hypothetical protein